jgi:translation elongation factor EF-4
MMIERADHLSPRAVTIPRRSKRRTQTLGQVDIPQEAFIAALKVDV